jgi:hypothetical protein
MNKFSILLILVTVIWVHHSRDVDEAWEAFHRAALGGTLASPAVQVDIEMALHKARELLAKGHDYVDEGDKESVLRISAEIKQITDKIKRESQRKKQ